VKKILIALVVAVTTLSAGVASAHMFWVNLTESFNHPPGHVVSELGFGHVLPIDDFLVGEHGVIKVKKYQVVGPDKTIMDLGLPSTTNYPINKSDMKLNWTKGDIGLRKIGLTPDAANGTYQVNAESVPMFFTKYINTKGKERMAPVPMDKVKDMKTPLASFKYQSFAKSFFSIGKWTKPEPMGYDLEIMPLTDLSDLHVGDLVEFMVTFSGKPVTASSKSIRTLTCTSNTYGGPDGFHLGSVLTNGKARFRMPAAGQWLVNIFYDEVVEGSPELVDLKGKCTKVFTAGTVFFNVKP